MIFNAVYINSFLASLNCRNRIRQQMAGIVNVESQLSNSIRVDSANDVGGNGGFAIGGSNGRLQVGLYAAQKSMRDEDPSEKVQSL